MNEEAKARCIVEAGAAEVDTVDVQAFTPSPFGITGMAGGIHSVTSPFRLFWFVLSSCIFDNDGSLWIRLSSVLVSCRCYEDAVKDPGDREQRSGCAPFLLVPMMIER